MPESVAGDGQSTAGEPATTRQSSRLAVAALSPVAALTLLTVLPLPRGLQHRIGAREVAASAPWFPVVGLILGLVVGGVASLALNAGHAALGGALGAVLLAGLTGALHLDGLADSADALGARGGLPARRLEIMRDPATGVYGTAAIVGWCALVTTAIASLPANLVIPLVLWALVLGRTAAVRHARILPPARAGGLGAGFSVSKWGTATAVLFAIATGVSLCLPDSPSRPTPATETIVAMVIVATAISALVTNAAKRLIGGRTGDTLGATVALVEAAALVTAALVN